MVSMEVSDRGKVSMAASSRELVSIEGSSRRPRRAVAQFARWRMQFLFDPKGSKGGGGGRCRINPCILALYSTSSFPGLIGCLRCHKPWDKSNAEAI